jgi:hypothetical protein
MKRDMDLVRKILLAMNDHEHGFVMEELELDGYTQEQIGYHCFLLDEAGLIQASDVSTDDTPSPCALPVRLTWEGHEFIENAQNDKVWGQAKEAVGKIGDVSFSVWASVLSQIVMSNLGIGN